MWQPAEGWVWLPLLLIWANLAPLLALICGRLSLPTRSETGAHRGPFFTSLPSVFRACQTRCSGQEGVRLLPSVFCGRICSHDHQLEENCLKPNRFSSIGQACCSAIGQKKLTIGGTTTSRQILLLCTIPLFLQDMMADVASGSEKISLPGPRRNKALITCSPVWGWLAQFHLNHGGV
ncbi:hypothetical protein QBC47DRAFT_390771, partial [Echria macrotheca]